MFTRDPWHATNLGEWHGRPSVAVARLNFLGCTMASTSTARGGLVALQTFTEQWDALLAVLKQEKKAGTGRVIVVVSVVVLVLAWWLLLVAGGVAVVAGGGWVGMTVGGCFGYIGVGGVGGVCHGIWCWWLVGRCMMPVGGDNGLQS